MDTEFVNTDYVHIDNNQIEFTDAAFLENSSLSDLSAQPAPTGREPKFRQHARQALNQVGRLSQQTFQTLENCSAKQLVQTQNTTLLKALIKCRPMILEREGDQLALSAAGDGYTDGVLLLINKKAPLWRETLSTAAQNAHHDCFVQTLAYGLKHELLADGDVQHKFIESLIHLLFKSTSESELQSKVSQRAVQASFSQIFEKLLPQTHLQFAGKSPDDKEAFEEATRLTQKSLATKLMNKTILPEKNRTLFHLMAQYGNAHTLSWCLKARGDQWKKDADGKNALQLSLLELNESTLGELTYRRPDQFYSQDQQGNTIFHYLAQREDPEDTQVSELSEVYDFVEIKNNGSILESGPINALRVTAIENCIKIAKEEGCLKALQLSNHNGLNCEDIALASKSASVCYLLATLKKESEHNGA